MKTIFHIPQYVLDVNRVMSYYLPKSWLSGAKTIMELSASFECTDGLPIDEIPIVRPQKPHLKKLISHDVIWTMYPLVYSLMVTVTSAEF